MVQLKLVNKLLTNFNSPRVLLKFHGDITYKSSPTAIP